MNPSLEPAPLKSRAPHAAPLSSGPLSAAAAKPAPAPARPAGWEAVSSETQLGGWGRFPLHACRVARPDGAAEIAALAAQAAGGCIARGLGRSYGDSATVERGGVLEQLRRDHFLAFDPRTGVLECEGGVSFAEIIRLFAPRGWFLPVTPGTKFVTVGGAIAADVHGKNHHVDGSFGDFVERFDLLLASGEVVRCSREERPELFWATIGGMGLTGVVLAARFRLRPLETTWFHVRYQQTTCLEETLDLFHETDRVHRYSVAWIDCLAQGESLGRSVAMLSNDPRRDELPSKLAARPLEWPLGRAKTVPFDFPGFALNSWSVRAFNALYYAVNATGWKFVHGEKFFYPLDGVLHWNRIYGRRGFVQYQVLLPPESSRKGLRDVLERVAASGRASFLAVLKSSGPANGGMLSFPFRGHTLALDFPFEPALPAFVQELDRVLLDYGGRLYLAKDALMSAETFARMYPRLDEFRQVRETVDPHGRWVSAQARRLGIV